MKLRCRASMLRVIRRRWKRRCCVSSPPPGPSWRTTTSAARGAGASDAAHGPKPVLRRIMRLLGLAGSSNVHEAEAAMNESRRLMLLHNIDAAVAAGAGGFSFRQVGAVKARSDASERILA